MNTRRTKAFTLIELLVVISIVGLLSSVVLASLNAARDKADIAAGKQFEANMQHAYAANAVGIWTLDEGTGTVIKDSTGQLAEGNFSVTQPTWVTGVDGKALNFNGSSYVNLPDLTSAINLVGGTNGAVLVMAWIRPMGTNDFKQFVTGFPAMSYFAHRTDGTLIVYNTQIGVNTWYGSASSVPLNKWTHVAFLFEAGKGYKFFINGKLNQEGKSSSYVIENNGAYPTRIGSSFVGDVDSVRVYYYTI